MFGQSDARPASTPMVHGAQLLPPNPEVPLDEGERDRLADLPYCSLVGSLMYIAAGTQPDIMFAVSKLARLLNCYREVHWQAAICIVRYLKGTRKMTLRLGASTTTLALVGYSDSDYTNDPGPDGCKSIGGYCFSLGSSMVSWTSKKQCTVADSTCAAEYIAASEAGRELIWLRGLMSGLGYQPDRATPLLCDNTAATLLCADQAFHSRVKHLDIRYHWIRGCVESGDIIVTQIPSSDNIADILTKALPGPQFVKMRSCLGLQEVDETIASLN